MPKDKKKSLKKKKDEGNSVDNGEKFKRRNSLTDASSTSSSSDSSVSSSTSTTSSLDSEENYSNSIGTMTKDRKKNNGEGSSNSGVNSEGNFVDNINAPTKPIQIVDSSKGVAVSENTHLKYINEENGSHGKGSQDTPSSSKNSHSKKKKNQRERQKTKKEKRDMANSDGKAVQNEADGYSDKLSKRQLESLINYQNFDDIGPVQVHQFSEYGAVRTGDMRVEGLNEAARNVIGGDAVHVPFYQLPPRIEFLDGHQIAQSKYLKNTPIKKYGPMTPEKKLSERMGFGIAASGMKDNFPEMLSINGASYILKDTYSEAVRKSYNLDNWRNNFAATLMNDGYNREPRHKELECHMRRHVEKIVTDQKDSWIRETMKLVLKGDLKNLMVRLGEMDRILIKKDIEMRKSGVGVNIPRYDEGTHRERFRNSAKVILEWMKAEILEHAPEEVNRINGGEKLHIIRGVSVIMYLSASHHDEKPCFQTGHKKCMMLDFLLGAVDSETRRKFLLQSFINCLTPLHFAAMTGWPCQIDVLLKYGSATEITSDYLKTPICFAARRNCTLMARQLMWHGADLAAVSRVHSGLQELDFAHSSYNGYMSRKFIDERLKALQGVFDAWLNTYLSECDPRLKLKIGAARSDLHQSRIGCTVLDKIVHVNAHICLKQVILNVPQATCRGPLVLFLIPACYTRMDTTMKSHYPHIVRVPMIHRAHEAAHNLQLASSRDSNNEQRKQQAVKEVLHSLRPCQFLTRCPTISFSEGDADREMLLKPFFEQEHNGILYAYAVPDFLDKISRMTRITLTLPINVNEIHQFENCFFMVQLVELNVQKADEVKPVLDVRDIEVKINQITAAQKNRNA